MKKKLALLLVAVMLAGSLAGCGKTDGGESADVAIEEETAEETESETAAFKA